MGEEIVQLVKYMPVKIRLQRVGKKDQPLFRLVVCDQHAKANGKTLAILGSVNLSTKPKEIKYDKKELEKWERKGVKASETVVKLLSL